MRLTITESQTRTIAFLVALIILVIGGIAGYIIGGLLLLLSIEVALLVAIFLLRPILKPRLGHFKTRLATLVIFGEIASSIFRGESWIVLLLNFGVQQIGLPPIQPTEPHHQILLLTITGAVLIVLTWLFERRQILTPVTTIIAEEDEPFQEPDYKILRNRFCKFMYSYLDRIDEETNWSDNDYTSLEAEIEMTRQHGKSSIVIADLIKAIRKDQKSQSFLLIGDPGSGKSVSLRRLARELYEEVPKQGSRAVVPVYINLKEWTGPQKPTDEDISNYVYHHLLRISGRAGQGFLKNYYEKMLSNGLFFFMFDSFDEMPMILDFDDRSDQLKQIAIAFDTFFKDLHKCRGILSSRPFRQPIGFRGHRLTIRPFHEKQIRDAMKNWLLGEGLDADQIVRRLLIERPHLAPALRNPFMSDLIAHYVIHYRDKLPSSHYDLFNHYINKRFDEDTSTLEELKLTKENVIDAAIEIAKNIYNTPDSGLEISTLILKNTINDPQIEDKIKAMQYSRIARWGGTSMERFSFVHRRFAEFFAVCALLKNPAMIDRDAIPSDSRWRDSFVVYCGIAPDKEVSQLTEYAWKIIQENAQRLVTGNVQEARPAIHCLRFLRDACQSRLESIEHFQEDLSKLIVELIGGKDLLSAKIAAEALPIVTPSARTRGITTAFTRGISWLSETALRSCRHLAELESQAVEAIRKYIKTLPTPELLKSFKDLDFSLSLSDSLQSVRFGHRVDTISILLLWILSLIILVYIAVASSVKYSFMLLTMVMIFEVIFGVFRGRKSSRKRRFWSMLTFRPGFDSSIRLLFFLYILFSMSSQILGNTQIDPDPFSTAVFDLGWVLSLLLIVIVIPSDFFIKFVNSCIHWKLSISWIHRNLKSILVNVGKGLLFIIFALLQIKLFTVLEKYMDWILLIYFVFISVIFIYPGCIIILLLKRWLWKISKDYLLLKKLKLVDELTWAAVYQTTNRLRTNWGQSRYLKMLRTQKIHITDLDAISHPLSLVGPDAEVEMARLKEQIYDIQE